MPTPYVTPTFLRARRAALFLALALAPTLGGCQKADKPGDKNGDTKTATGSGSAGAAAATAPTTPAEDIDSKDILTRTETSPEVLVKHVRVGWKDLAAAYRGHMDPRAAGRDNAAAAKLAKEILAKLKADPTQIDALSKSTSEDPGSQSGDPYTVKAETAFVPEFKQLALRLKLGEAGIVKTSYGYHVMERVAPPPPDPLESADILARPAEAGPVQVQHVLLGWKDAPAAARTKDPRAQRTKAEADKLAQDVLAKVKAGGDMAALMKEFSEDPGSKDNARAYDVTADGQMVEPFKNLSLRLKIGEAGLVKSPFGWHVIKRVPPPPPDTLESAEILKRAPTTEKAKVKHILLGWTETHAEDPRGVKRTRAELEKLVKETLAKLAKGDKIEPLMAELSEDPGSAKSGQSYDVTPSAGLVPPFKNLSLRLKVGEAGVVKSDFGIHIIQRTE
jgi:parvulin-like peptidyl-prolyl isomerase